ncbi:MAG TPA: BON domain-containing protein [Syntrophorhabdales bacterium]|nr:BON domain-containing protein [Syntrophorhabdales bacterium]
MRGLSYLRSRRRQQHFGGENVASYSEDYPSYRHVQTSNAVQPEEQHFGGGYWTFSGDEQKDLYGETRPGPYAGVGPKGYARSDARILEDVSERLMENGHVDASDIEVEVCAGEVILKGSVADRQMKRLAEDVAASALGVKDVQNQLRLKE